MKKLLVIVIVLAGLGGAGYYGYNFAIGYLSDQMVDSMMENMLDDQEINNFLKDPKIKEFMDNTEIGTEDSLGNPSISKETLPFSTKEDAMKTVLREFSLSEINNLSEEAMAGRVTMEDAEQFLGERLTEEEIQALKIILIQEYKNQ
ncbi:hypothetical protein [Evansella tamaricis]|uniref:Phenylalanyl-tRNA synthetase subunit beta n=1 Tax=Evansella tamaricis TaxID=2069301 RepID=A0ABS6JEA7_9BACI|nr:hypothetical protein [Evansella tamaricis]MBU9712009.1 hypothetical protein [Evansella tamaricis]